MPPRSWPSCSLAVVCGDPPSVAPVTGSLPPSWPAFSIAMLVGSGWHRASDVIGGVALAAGSCR